MVDLASVATIITIVVTVTTCVFALIRWSIIPPLVKKIELMKKDVNKIEDDFVKHDQKDAVMFTSIDDRLRGVETSQAAQEQEMSHIEANVIEIKLDIQTNVATKEHVSLLQELIIQLSADIRALNKDDKDVK